MTAASRPPRLALVGLGNRGLDVYGELVRGAPELATIVAVADPDAAALERAGRRLGVPQEARYRDAAALLAATRDLDAVVIATPDRDHVAPALAALERGLAVLLEKPIAPDLAQLRALSAAARDAEVTVAHVLRYAPFFRAVKGILDAGRLGRLVAIDHTENIGHWHFAHSYVRGNWRSEEGSSPMLLAKACHDLDLLRWLAGAPCEQVTSLGERVHFRAENAPEGAPERCSDGCPVEPTCPYAASRIYQQRFAGTDGWPVRVVAPEGGAAALDEALRHGPYGRCVYRCDNDVVDHQVVQMRFANGVMANLTVSAFTEENTRTVHLMGSHGELHGDLGRGLLELNDFASGRRERIEVGEAGAHGGGDQALMLDFLERVAVRLRGGERSSPTALGEALDSHLMAFAAERSRHEARSVRLSELQGDRP